MILAASRMLAPASKPGRPSWPGAGIGWFFTERNNPGLGSPPAFAFGLIVSALAAPLVAHAALAYPAGRMDSRLGLGAAVFAYAGRGWSWACFPPCS